MKSAKLFILVGVFVCLQTAVFAGHSKSFQFAVDQWVTANPPTSEEIAGHVCVVEFWATWCLPCRGQIPHMKALAKKYEDRNVIFMGLSEDQSMSEVRAFVEKKSINYHIGMDNGMMDRLGIGGIPTALVISHDGKIMWGGHPEDERFESTLEAAVKAAPKSMLSGLDMGPFSHLRIKLCGGKHFANAYAEVDGYAQKSDSPNKAVAGRIINTINDKLQQKIDAAQHVRNSDPQRAMAMYKELVDNYGGIKLTREIESNYRELQQKATADMTAAAPPQARAGI